MDDPEAEIGRVINLVAGAHSADEQIDAIEKYFTRDASFLHPLCYVPPAANSRARIALIYLFYRAIIPSTSFEIQSAAWDRRTNYIFVGLIQRPALLGIGLVFVPDIPMRIHCHLTQIGGKYYLDLQEDLIQPRSALAAFPILRWYAILFYWFCEVVGILMAYFLMTLGFWRPHQHLRNHFWRPHQHLRKHLHD